MKIKAVLIEDKVKEKVLDKHSVEAEEIREVLLGRLVVLKSKEERYVAFGTSKRYLTVVFTYREGVANIITAYPSSEAQVRLSKKKRI